MYAALTGIAFYVFAFITVFSAVMVISAKNPVHSVLFLILTFFASAGIFVLVGAEFIAMTLIIVYVGAVAVLFLFVVMMLDINITQLRQGFLHYLPLCIVIALILLGDLLLIINSSFKRGALPDTGTMPIPNPEIVTNTHAIGRVLYTNYLYPFQMAGLILFVAMIGSIVLTLRSRPGVRKQDASKQLMRTRASAVEIVKVKSGVGIDGLVD